MKENSTTIAVFPARGGSTRVKRKNIAEAGGKPLLVWGIEVARQSGLFDRILVNSEDEEILDVAKQAGAEPYLRPEALADNKTVIIDTLREMFDSLGLADDTVLGIMLPTCPLRRAEDLVGCHQLFQQHSSTVPAVSVAAYDPPVQLAQVTDANGRLVPLFPDSYNKSTRTVDHGTAYRYNGAVIFNTVGRLKQQKTLIGDRPLPYIMPAERSIDIDEPYQLELVRSILSQPSA